MKTNILSIEIFLLNSLFTNKCIAKLPRHILNLCISPCSTAVLLFYGDARVLDFYNIARFDFEKNSYTRSNILIKPIPNRSFPNI